MLKKVLSVAVLAVCASTAWAADDTAALKKTMECAQTAKESSECPYFTEFYESDAKFKRHFDETLSESGVSLMKGPDGPMEYVKINEQNYLSGFICEQHNCGNHKIVFLYEPALERVIGIYQPDGGQPSWIGIPTVLEAQQLIKAWAGE